MEHLELVWGRLGKEKDASGRSHAGLILFVNILVRHLVYGFQNMVSYQSFLAWLAFRPGLEALLIIGKFLDDPSNTEIWKKREVEKEPYIKTFSKLRSKSLPRSSDFQRVLTRINDNFMHPNPDFVYREMKMQNYGDKLFLEIDYFDSDKNVHEAHLIAYLNLLYEIYLASRSLIVTLYQSSHDLTVLMPFKEMAGTRASELAKKNPVAKRIMEDLGLWSF